MIYLKMTSFINDMFKPVSEIEKGAKYVFDGTIANPIGNVTSGVNNLFTGVGTGAAGLGTGVGQGFSGLGYGVGQGIGGLGQGIGDIFSSPILLIGGAVLVIYLLKDKS